MAYAVQVSPAASRDLDKLDATTFKRIDKLIVSLSIDPRPSGAKALQRHSSVYRLRAGDFRLVYEVRDRERIVLVVACGHRSKVYKLVGRRL